MANIQANVNQMISLASLLASQSPAYKAAVEKRGIAKNIAKETKALTEQAGPAFSAAEEAIQGINLVDADKVPEYAEQTVDPAMENVEELLQRKTELAKQEFELKPSEATYNKYLAGKRAIKSYEARATGTRNIIAEMKAERAAADTQLQARQEAMRETRRRILEGTPSEYVLREDM